MTRETPTMEPPSPALPPVVARWDRFTDVRPLGRGGMSVVFDVFDSARKARVALKTMHGVDAASVARLKTEFRALADVAHPNLVILHELFADDEGVFFTMELLDGQALLHHLRAGSGVEWGSGTSSGSGRAAPTVDFSSSASFSTLHEPEVAPVEDRPIATAAPVPSDRVRPVLLQLADGLNALHAVGKLHRDVKPSNVMVTGEGRVVLLDFGLAADAGPRQDHEIAGTPEYMSPEQMEGRPEAASDWYAVGVILYEALTGRLPWTVGRAHWRALLDQKRRPPEIRPSEIVPEVDPDLEALCLELLDADPSARPNGADIARRLRLARTPEPATLRRAPVVDLVGRRAQLDALDEAYEGVRRGRATAVFVSGTSGMGKSALVAAWLARVGRRAGALVLEGRCYERESMPYKGVDGVVEGLASALAAMDDSDLAAILPPNVAALARLFPAFERVGRLRVEAPVVPDRQELRARAFAALRELLRRVATRGPVVVHVDDLQWCDADGAALLTELLRPEAPAILLVGSWRAEERDRSPALAALIAGFADREVREIAVGPLADGEARQIAASLLGPEHAAHVGPVVAAAAGSPFFVQELARHVAETTEHELGTTLDRVLLARLERLPEGPRRLLEAVAVAGRPVAQRIARAAAGVPDDNVALVVLRAAHLVRTRGAVGIGDVETAHDRIREATVASLAPERLRELHGALAAALEEVTSADPETLADHHAAAGRPDVAAGYLLRAAEIADRALAFDRAAQLWRRLGEILPADHPDAASLPAKLADALANAGRSAEAAKHYLAAADRADGQARLEYQRRAAEQYLISGHIDDGLRVFDDVLERVGLALAKTPRRALLSLLFRRLWLRIRGLRYRERGADAIPGDAILKIDATWAVSRGLGMVDNIRGADFQTRHLLLALAAGEPYRIARGLAMEAAFLSGRGGATRAAAELLSEKARSLAQVVGHPHAIGLATLTAGMGAYLRGDWRKGLVLCREAEAVLRDRCTGVSWELANSHRFALGAQMYLGELGAFHRGVLERLEHWRERGNRYVATDLRTRFHLAWLVVDQPDEAERQIDAAMAEWSMRGFHLQHYSALFARTQVDLYRERPEEAWRRLTETWPALEHSMLLRIQMVKIEILQVRARTALALAAKGVDAEAMLGRAEADAATIAKERMAWADPLAALLRAGAADVRGDAERAGALLGEAIRGFDAAEMGAYAAAARWRLRDDSGRATLVREGVVAPERLVGALAPGFRRG